MNVKGKSRTAAEGTADSLRGSILRGEMPPGSTLPAERELSERLGVSRLTLRSAIARLETEGLVQPVQGSGTRVLDYRERGGVGLIGYLAAQALEGGKVPDDLLRDLLEVRRMIAVELVALVADRASDDELRELRRHHAVMATLVGDAEAFKNADLAFGRQMIRAGHNFALELLFNSIVRVIASNPGLTIAFQANAPQALAVYARMLDLVEAHDGPRAARVTRRLLTVLDGRTLALVDQLLGRAS